MKISWKIAFQVFLLFSYKNIFSQHTVHYDLWVRDTVISYAGKKAHDISINDEFPGPPLTFTEGDTADITVHNTMNVETSIHWHGIILPNDQDGVPYLTNAPIKPHSIYTYRFPIVQSGTYWYHSHTDLQEQSGLFGALIIHKKQPDTIPEYTVIFSDWTHEKPHEVLRTLKMANDWYSIEKRSTQNWGEALVKGYFKEKIRQEWQRMLPMDVSDVYYDAFLANGLPQQNLPALKAGDKIRLRIINGSSSTNFWLQFAGGKIAVVSSDGSDVVPVEVDRMLIAVAETYDVIVTIPESMTYEFKATAEDRTKSASLWLGNGARVSAPILQPLRYFAGMKMMNDMRKMRGMQMSMQQMDMNTAMYPEISGSERTRKKHRRRRAIKMETNPGGDTNTLQDIVTLNYSMLRSPVKTTLPAVSTTTLKFNLTGNMNRYQWSINNKLISEAKKIIIHKGENVRIVLYNASMMRHPMHIHGHFFRIINGQGDYAPLKNVLDILPMETDTIEFAALYDGDWFFHCHILYHMMSGMGRIFSYANSPPNPSVDTIKHAWHKFLMDDKMFFWGLSATVQTNGAWVTAMAINKDFAFDVMGEANYAGSFITETHFGRYMDKNQFFKLYIGTDIRMLSEAGNYLNLWVSHHLNEWERSDENRKVAVLGLQYLLPFFIVADLRIDDTGRPRLQLSRSDLPLTSRLRLDWMFNSDLEYEIGLRYIITKRISVNANYDDHFGAGIGMSFTY